MLELTSAGRPVVLSPGTSVGLEYNSPLFDEEVIRGSFSYSFAVPAPPNGPLYGFPERLDADVPAGAPLPAELGEDGLALLVGSQRVRSASVQRYSVAVTGGLSALAPALSERALHSFAYGGFRAMPAGEPVGSTQPGGLVQLPGWVRHANAVVRHPEAYDYVFAPVRAENFFEPAPAPSTDPNAPLSPPRPPAVLNPWVAEAGPANPYGLPAGGTFTHFGFIGYQKLVLRLPDIFNPGNSAPYRSDEGTLLPVLGTLACPFPRLRYVLRHIFQESGHEVDEARFLPGELGELVIVSPADAMRTSRDADGVVQSGFYLADALPDVSVAQLLLALRKGLGVVVDVDPVTQRVYTTYLKDVVAAPALDDWTDRLAGPAEVQFEDATALKLVYETDSEDEVTKQLLSQVPDPATLSPAVQTLADLPAMALLGTAAETRLVRDEAAYFRSRATSFQNPTPVVWEFVAAQLDGLAVGGADGEEISQGFAFTQMGRAPFQLDPLDLIQLDPAATQFMEVPAMSRPGYEPTNLSPKAPARPTALRLLFFRGLQPASDGSLYPLLTPLATNQAGQAVGSLSLRLTGPAGTYQQLLRGWLEVKRRGVVVKQALRLSVLDLARLDQSRKVRLDGVEYLVRKLAVSVPLQKPASAELVRV